MTDLEHAKLLLTLAKELPADAKVEVCGGKYVECGGNCKIRTADRNCLLAGAGTVGKKIQLLEQWIKDNEAASVIDLTKTQIVEPPVQCWVRQSEEDRWEKETLVIIDHRRKRRPFVTLEPDSTYFFNVHCTLTDPYAATTKQWKTMEDVPAELWGKAWVKRIETPVSSASILQPAIVSFWNGNLFGSHLWMPIDENPLTGTWRLMETTTTNTQE